MSDELITSNLLSLWLGFSLMFVLLVGLWLFVAFDAKMRTPPPRWRQLVLRWLFFVLIGVGALGAASTRGDWTALSLWVGLAIGLWVVVWCFGDPRKWGKAE